MQSCMCILIYMYICIHMIEVNQLHAVVLHLQLHATVNENLTLNSNLFHV